VATLSGDDRSCSVGLHRRRVHSSRYIGQRLERLDTIREICSFSISTPYMSDSKIVADIEYVFAIADASLESPGIIGSSIAGTANRVVRTLDGIAPL